MTEYMFCHLFYGIIINNNKKEEREERELAIVYSKLTKSVLVVLRKDRQLGNAWCQTYLFQDIQRRR